MRWPTTTAASKHVSVLQRAGLVDRHLQGRRHMCRLNPAPLAPAQQFLKFYEHFWTHRLDALESVLGTDGSGAPDIETRTGPTTETRTDHSGNP